MYAIEFETSIDNGIIHIPETYKELQKNKKAKVIILIDDKATTEENPQRLTFDKFLSNSKKVDHLTISSRDELHER